MHRKFDWWIVRINEGKNPDDYQVMKTFIGTTTRTNEKRLPGNGNVGPFTTRKIARAQKKLVLKQQRVTQYSNYKDGMEPDTVYY